MRMARSPRDVTDAELDVLRLLWDEGEAPIRALADRLYPGGGPSEYATVQKLLERLEDKGHVARRSEGRANVFSAQVRREDLVARRLRDTAEKLCDGSLTPLLTHLVSAGRLSPDELLELRRLVDRLARKA
jgi:BlaI family transcriptional regulator, penicillinase repressor